MADKDNVSLRRCMFLPGNAVSAVGPSSGGGPVAGRRLGKRR
jgi:hypothetical protein